MKPDIEGTVGRLVTFEKLHPLKASEKQIKNQSYPRLK
jgi:hypothetical protein